MRRGNYSMLDVHKIREGDLLFLEEEPERFYTVVRVHDDFPSYGAGNIVVYDSGDNEQKQLSDVPCYRQLTDVAEIVHKSTVNLQPGQKVYYLNGSPPTFIEIGYVRCSVESEYVDDLWRLSCHRPDNSLWHETRIGNIFVDIGEVFLELENRINWQINHYKECLERERKRVQDNVYKEGEP